MTKEYPFFLFTLWTKGEPVERSLRRKQPPSAQQHQPQQEATQPDDQLEQYGYSSTYDAHNPNVDGFTRQANKRDSFNEMLSNRDMHTQVGQNPFLAGESYLKHLKIQEDFLRPQNTNTMDSKTNG